LRDFFNFFELTPPFQGIYGMHPRDHDPQPNPFSLKLIPPSKKTPPFTRHFQKNQKKSKFSSGPWTYESPSWTNFFLGQFFIFLNSFLKFKKFLEFFEKRF
jgi:hypothetical protein